MAFDFEPSIILETAPQLLGGMKLTLIITLGGLLVGLLLGVVTGLANTSRSRFLRGIAILYIEAIRGTPLIVQVMFLSACRWPLACAFPPTWRASSPSA